MSITINITLPPALEVALLRLIAPAAAPEDGVAALREAFAGLRRDFGRELWNLHAAIDRIAASNTGPGATETSVRPAEATGGSAPERVPDGTAADAPLPACAPHPAGEAVASAPCSPAPADSPEDTPREPDPPYMDWLTPERSAVLRRGWVEGVQTYELRARMQALPGPRLPDNGAIASRASMSLKVRRPAGFRFVRPSADIESPAPHGPPPRAPLLAVEMVPAIPPALASRDGAPSVTALMQARELRDHAAEPITLNDALNWARANKVPLVSDDPAALFAGINDARRALGLAPWRRIAQRGLPEPLPPATVGGGYGDAP